MEDKLLLTEEMRHWCPDCLMEVVGSAYRDTILEQCVGKIPEQHMWLILDAAQKGYMQGERSVLNPDG